MTNISIYGKTNKKDRFVKIDSKEECIISNTILPDIDTNEAKMFDKNYIQEDKEQLLYIDLSGNDEIMKKFIDMFESTTSFNLIEQNEFNKLKYIFIGKKNDNGSWNLKFQRLYPRYYFERASIRFDQECKLKEAEKIIILNKKTDVYYSGIEKRVYFYDFTQANIIINLMMFYRDANAQDFENFKKISILDVTLDTQNIGQRYGKKIAQMLDDKVFETKNLQQIKAYAKKYKQELSWTNPNKIKIETNKDIGLIFDIMEERFFTKEISKEKCRTNSYEKIGSANE